MTHHQPSLAPALPGASTARGSRHATAVLHEYPHLLVTRLAAHGTCDDPGRCRCGHLRPCAEEHRVADLVDMAGSACRLPTPPRSSGTPAILGFPEPGQQRKHLPPRRTNAGH